MKKSICCNAPLLKDESGVPCQCEACGADGRDPNPFNDPEHNELLDEKLKYND
jgi:hypothetical protein